MWLGCLIAAHWAERDEMYEYVTSCDLGRGQHPPPWPTLPVIMIIILETRFAYEKQFPEY